MRMRTWRLVVLALWFFTMGLQPVTARNKDADLEVLREVKDVVPELPRPVEGRNNIKSKSTHQSPPKRQQPDFGPPGFAPPRVAIPRLV